MSRSESRSADARLFAVRYVWKEHDYELMEETDSSASHIVDVIYLHVRSPHRNNSVKLRFASECHFNKE